MSGSSHTPSSGADPPDSIRPWRNVETAGFTEVQQHGPVLVQQGEGRAWSTDTFWIATLPFDDLEPMQAALGSSTHEQCHRA